MKCKHTVHGEEQKSSDLYALRGHLGSVESLSSLAPASDSNMEGRQHKQDAQSSTAAHSNSAHIGACSCAMHTALSCCSCILNQEMGAGNPLEQQFHHCARLTPPPTHKVHACNHTRMQQVTKGLANNHRECSVEVLRSCSCLTQVSSQGQETPMPSTSHPSTTTASKRHSNSQMPSNCNV